MIEILEKRKTINQKDTVVIASALITAKDFEGVKDKANHARYFNEHHLLFKGIATLREGDESNVVEATRIALAKMERAYYRHISRTQRKIMRDAIHTFNETSFAYEDTEKNLNHINSHIKAICDRL